MINSQGTGVLIGNFYSNDSNADFLDGLNQKGKFFLFL